MAKTALTVDDLEVLVTDELYHVFPGTTLTVCCLILDTGFTVTGESACIDPATFDSEVGRGIARDEAINKLWQLEGYRKQAQLHDQGEL